MISVRNLLFAAFSMGLSQFVSANPLLALKSKEPIVIPDKCKVLLDKKPYIIRKGLYKRETEVLFRKDRNKLSFYAHDFSDSSIIHYSYFPKLATKYFTYIAAGQDVAAPSVSNFTVDLLDAKFKVDGAVTFANGRVLINAGFSGDRDGNIATLFNGDKSGGKLEGDLSIGWNFYRMFTFNNAERLNTIEQIREAELAAYKQYCSALSCPQKTLESQECQAIQLGDYEILKPEVDAQKIKSITKVLDSLKNAREKIYDKTKFVRITYMWVNLKGNVGASRFYNISRAFLNGGDTVPIQKDNSITGFLGA